jgi:hypothetical protein
MQTPATAASPVLRVVTERDDYRAFVRYTDQTVFRRRFWAWVVAVPAILVAATVFEAWRAGGWANLVHSDPVAVLVPGAIFLWAASRWQAIERKARRMAQREYPGLRDLKLESDGLVVESGPRRRKYAWKDIVEVVEANGLLLFVHARAPGLFKATMVPLRPEASDPRHIGPFRQRAVELWGAARAPRPLAVAAAAPQPAPAAA